MGQSCDVSAGRVWLFFPVTTTGQHSQMGSSLGQSPFQQTWATACKTVTLPKQLLRHNAHTVQGACLHIRPWYVPYYWVSAEVHVFLASYMLSNLTILGKSLQETCFGLLTVV